MRIFKIDELQYEESISNRELGKQRKRKQKLKGKVLKKKNKDNE